jgi:hypothetical protein
MKNNTIVVLTLVLLEILIGILGELMPDTLKTSLNVFFSNSIGIQYVYVWVTIFTLSVIALLFVFIKNQKIESKKNKKTDNNGAIEDKIFNQKANKIYNIEHIDNAKFE